MILSIYLNKTQKGFNLKLLLLFLFSISSLVAETTLCYKKDAKNDSLGKTILLNGGECQGKLSVLSMEKIRHMSTIILK